MLNTFWTYSLWALQFLFVEQLKLISTAIALAFATACIATFRSFHPSPKSSYLTPLLLLIAFPLTIAIAIFFPARAMGNPNRIGSWLLNSLDILSLAFAIYCIYRAKGIRWFIAALILVELWLIAGAGIIAGMSVSGDWI